jgi:hypothetical protein
MDGILVDGGCFMNKDGNMDLERGVDELEQAYECLLARDRHKFQYIQKVTQSLRLPVTNLNLYLKLLKDGRPDKKHHYIYVMEEQLAQLSEIVIALVAYTDSEQISNKDSAVLGKPLERSHLKKKKERLAIY